MTFSNQILRSKIDVLIEECDSFFGELAKNFGTLRPEYESQIVAILSEILTLYRKKQPIYRKQ